MNDLISRQALIISLERAKTTCKGLHEYVFFDAVIAIVDAQPTAYDVDKVVEQLDEAYNNGTLGDYHNIVKGAVKE